MNHDFPAAVASMAPPESMASPKGFVSWFILVSALGTASLSVKLLPRAHPVRIFIEGTISLVLDGVTATPSAGHPVDAD